MRKAFRVLVMLLCILALMMPVFAADNVESLHSSTSLSPDGSCQVSINLTINLESRQSELNFPLPKGASGATVNGSSARIFTENGIPMISLSKAVSGMTGSISLSIFYRVSSVLMFDENEELTAVIPLLSGFSCPVEYLDFTVSFPEEIPEYSRMHINYYDTYLLDSVESIISYTVEGRTITGVTLETLKDHDSLQISLPVSREHFPDSLILKNSSPWTQVAMAVCAAAAILYWLLFLRFIPPRAQHQTVVPGSITAGEVGTILSNQGISLPLMILSWAQMGYVKLAVNRKGHVTVSKRMDMGNERSRRETRIFSALFKKRTTVDTASSFFTRLNQRVYASKDARRGYFVPGFGRTSVYGYLFAAAGFFGGIAVGNAWFLSGFLMIFWCVVLALFGAVSAIMIQNGIACLFLHRTDRKIYAAVCMMAWIILGSVSGQMGLCLAVIGLEIFAGFTGPYSGRRTAAGRQILAELIGLHCQIRTLEKQGVLTRDNPDYFYQLLPFAMAFSLEGTLAKAFAGQPISDCTYLSSGPSPRRSSAQFASYLRGLISAMDEGRKNLPYERILHK